MAMNIKTLTKIVLPLVLWATPFAAKAQFTYTTNGNYIIITGYTGTNGDVVIPSTINGLPVVTIGDFAFFNDWTLTNVTLPNGLGNIGIQTFAGCMYLAGVIIPPSVTNIGPGAFAYCIKLKGF